MSRYTIRPESDTPVYRQLVDQINAEIRSGALKAGERLPTVREMAERVGLSCGTVKRAYDCLQEMGDIEMSRRRGTFVKLVRETADSRKIRAMAAIDTMIRRLTELNFSPAEIHIFLSLKEREWGMKWSGVRIALVTGYTELESCLFEQLRQLGNVSVRLWELAQVRENPYHMDEQSDVILASREDAARLQPLLPDPGKLIRIAFGAERESVRALLRAREGSVGALCRSEAFAALVRGYLGEDVCVRMEGEPLEELEGLRFLVIGEGYEAACGSHSRSLIDHHRAAGTLLTLRYGIDEGSMLCLEERMAQLREERQLRPAAPF